MAKYSGLAIASLVLGIIGLLLGWVPILGWIVILTGLILGIVALIEINQNRDIQGRGLAITGIVLNALAVILVIVFAIFAVNLFQTATQQAQQATASGNQIIPNITTEGPQGMELDEFNPGVSVIKARL